MNEGSYTACLWLTLDACHELMAASAKLLAHTAEHFPAELPAVARNIADQMLEANATWQAERFNQATGGAS